MALTGDFSKLAALIAAVGKISERGALRRVSLALSEEAVHQVRECFAHERDPYGVPWAPLRKRKGRILRDTGRLANSFHRRGVTAAGFAVTSNVAYAAIHQEGADVKRAGRFNRHNKKGRFQSVGQAGRRKKGAVRVSYAKAHVQTVPVRMMVPTEARGLGPLWTKAFEDAARGALDGIFEGRALTGA